MTLVYRFLVWVYYAIIRFSALWNEKAKKWVAGRKTVFEDVRSHIPANQPLIWIHASSAGEFEQAKPVIEKIKQLFPSYFILVSFFSPSGYQVAGKYPYADFITYIPLDTPRNAARFVNTIQPRLVLFVKYDFWYYHLKAVADNHIPLLLISSTFRANQLFFKWYGGFYKRLLHFFTHIFVQDNTSLSLLQLHGISNSSISGDTRFDRVAAIAHQFTDIPFVTDFIDARKAIVAGSTWEDDHAILSQFFEQQKKYKLIIAPHEITIPTLLRLQQQFDKTILYSELKTLFIIQPELTNAQHESAATSQQSHSDLVQKCKEATVLIIDNVGMLSRLYYYGTICYIGGGFTKSGIHNVLEAAVYGKPVLFGPNYHKFHEAVALIEKGGGYSILDAPAFTNTIKALENPSTYQSACNASKNYVAENKGATAAILSYIQENRLLTN